MKFFNALQRFSKSPEGFVDSVQKPERGLNQRLHKQQLPVATPHLVAFLPSFLPLVQQDSHEPVVDDRASLVALDDDVRQSAQTRLFLFVVHHMSK